MGGMGCRETNNLLPLKGKRGFEPCGIELEGDGGIFCIIREFHQNAIMVSDTV